MQAMITIVVEGETEDDISLAIDEAVRGIKAGCVLGHDRNDTGAYRFEVTQYVEPGELPA